MSTITFIQYVTRFVHTIQAVSKIPKFLANAMSVLDSYTLNWQSQVPNINDINGDMVKNILVTAVDKVWRHAPESITRDVVT